MIKEGDPPISFDLLEEARSNLSRDYGFALGEEDGRTVLFVRAPESKPDPFHTLEVVSFAIAEGDLAGVKDVFLIGDARVVRVEPDTLRELVEERREEDPEVAKHLRNRLDRDHDYTVFRHKGARDHLRLGVRVPRERVDDLRDEDRQALADQLAPILGSEKGRQIRAFYLIGDEHARRVAEDELLELAGPALREAVEARADPEPPDEEPDIETEPPDAADTIGTATGGPGADGSPTPDPDASRGAEVLESGSPSSTSGGASQEEPGQQPPGAGLEPDDDGGSTPKQQPPGAGLEPDDDDGSTPKQQPPGANLDTGDSGGGSSTGSQQPPGAGLGDDPSPGGPPNLDEIDESEIEDDGGAMFLDSDGDEDPEPATGSDPGAAGPDEPGSPSPGSQPAGGEADPSSPSPAGQEPSSEDPSPGGGTTPSGSGASAGGGSAPAGSGGTSPAEGTGSSTGSTSSSSGGSADFSPDDDGIAGLAGRGNRFDRPEPDEGGGSEPSPDEPAEAADAGGPADEGDDMIVAEVDQAPEGEVPAPDEADPAQADGAASPDATVDGPGADAAGSGPTETGAGETPAQAGGADTTEAAGPAEPQGSPAAQAAARLREAGYEVVEGVEAGGQPFDFAADREGGKRLLGLAVEVLDPDGVEALVEAGRASGADAVLAIPMDLRPGAREAAWGTVVDILRPEAVSALDL